MRSRCRSTRFGIMRLVSAATLILTGVGSGASPADDATGLWGWHTAWESAPAEIVKETGPSWSAYATLVNFCPGGRLRIATGVLYRGTGSATLGPSDGLAVYEGRWTSSGDTITATYRLVDSEIPFFGIDLAMRTEFTEHPRIRGGKLLFAFHHYGKESAAPRTFKRATTRGEALEDQFVNCDGHGPGETSEVR